MRSFCLLLAICAVLSRPAFAQEEVIFVFGSDTSTPGIRVDRFAAVYPESGFGMFADPDRQGYGIMDAQLRERYRDSYGTPLKLTWWMQGGSLYRPALNTNVPLPSAMSTHLMYRHHRDAMERFGDEMTFHFHSWVWTDYDGDGRFYWNQAKSFDESRADFDMALAEHLIEEDLFPVSFRSGWHYMDNLWQARLNSLLPFSLHNAWPGMRSETSEPIDNVFDWGRSPRDFVPYRPSPEDYQLPGGMRGWNTGSIYMKRADEAFVRGIFEAARSGERQVVCIWSHLAEADFVDQVEAAAEAIEKVAAEFSDVPFRYATGVEAMQRWLGTDDPVAPSVSLEEISLGDRVAVRIISNEALFQPVPFAALLDRYERYRPLDVRVMDFFTTLDDADPQAYEEQGGWRTSVTEAHGERSRYVFAEPGASAAFTGIAERAGVYAWSFLVPRTENAAVRAQYVLSAEGEVLDTVVVDQNVGSGSWRALGLYELETGERFRIEIAWAELDQPGRVLRADAVRLFRVGAMVDEFVVDNDSGGGAYAEEGNWSTSVSRESYGPSSRFMPAEGGGRATYHATITRSGMHGIYQIVPTTVNAAERAVYRISRGGTPIDSVFIGQNEGSGAWRFLTAIWLEAGDEAAVEVAHRGPAEPGRVLRADAIRFVYGTREATASESTKPAPASFVLGPNYPNPVQHSTSFTYALDRPADVRIALFDLLGREVARVADSHHPAGTHTARFDASELSSGVYFCRMKADGYTSTRAWTVVR